MSSLHSVWSFLYSNSFWMGWNLFLALIPLVLSLFLFQPDSRSSSSLFWWLGILAFVAFLPNAPYVVTDLIHLIRAIQATDSLLFNLLVILPTYLLFVLVGFEAYVVCLINLGRFLQQKGLSHWTTVIELLLHGLCAIGVYLGRIQRLNSWDLVVRPTQVLQKAIASVTTTQGLLFILLATGVITLLYAILKAITLALWLHGQNLRLKQPNDLPTQF